ncbi:MAG: hypothetical protein HYZ25_16160 [Chloroflexi bacterium]|nr:hypothetical protein [Chloroflexota bacterium]
MTTRLLELIAAPENLLSAWRSVRGNIPKYRRSRASGPDGVSLADFEQDLTTQLKVLRDMLLKGRYQPSPPAYFDIPKKNGAKRTLAILSVQDRVAQRAAQQVLEPLWEPDFLPCSFGFRPGISLERAVAHVQNLRRNHNGWVVDGDIAACFDTLDHDILMSFVQHKIKDQRTVALLQNWLDVGVMQVGPPQNLDMQAATRVENAKGIARQGLNWVLESLMDQTDPYGAYEYYSDDPVHPSAQVDDSTFPDRGALVSQMRKGTLRRLMASGVMMGVGFVRARAGGVFSKAGTALRTVASSPLARRLLKRNALTVGGFAGLAAAAAVTAYLLNRKAGAAPLGVLQGSPLSPLLANVYLHPFDVHLSRTGYQLARFADDWVVLCPSREQAENAYNDAVRSLARLHLKINTDKTKILAPDQPLEWLGAVIR